MNAKTYRIEIITPCFCAGADQTRAEIRVPSIRGQLRWWFRALGGSPAQEREVFGGVPKSGAVSSAVRLQVRGFEPSPKVPIPFEMKINQPGSYIWFFASKSSDGKRWWNVVPNPKQRVQGSPNPDGFISPGSQFDLKIMTARGLGASESLFEQALECFLRFGCIGMRATRAMGALFCDEFSGDLKAYQESAQRLLQTCGFAVQWGKETHHSWERAVLEAERALKEMRAVYKAGRPSALGDAKPRQSSAVYFRPVKVSQGDGQSGYRLLIFEAPHERVMGKAVPEILSH